MELPQENSKFYYSFLATKVEWVRTPYSFVETLKIPIGAPIPFHVTREQVISIVAIIDMELDTGSFYLSADIVFLVD